MFSGLQTRRHRSRVGVVCSAVAIIITMVCPFISPLPSYAEGGALLPNLVDPSAGQPRDSSCPPNQSDFCVTVDIYGNALMYNGTNWTAPRNVVPAGLFGSEMYVSCPSASFCAVVSDEGYATTYNGVNWSLPLPLPAEVTGLACASSTFCVATVAHDVIYFNGTDWSSSATIDAADFLQQVSCPSTTFCMATDNVGNAFAYDGISWSTPTSIDPSVDLTTLSCASADFCMALDGLDNNDRYVTYDGIAWSAPTAMSTSEQLFFYLSVSCTSSEFCAAVSAVGNVVTYDGGTWSSARVIDPGFPGTYPGLGGVACATASMCVAVDQDGNVFSFDGSSWSPPNNVDPIVGNLTDVSCATIDFCMAVDTFGHALTYNGSIWSAPKEIDPTPFMSGNDLLGVSCAPGNHIFCVAVDNAGQSLTYNGSVWASPIADNGMWYVSCPTTNFCAAIGGGDSAGEASEYNGTSWSAPTPVPSGTDGVSCASDAFCMAPDGNAVMTYSGTGWSGPTTIDSTDTFVAVTCSTVSFCMATDNDGNAFTYNGVGWTTPVVVDSGRFFYGLACSGVSFCEAVDDYGDSFTYDGSSWSGPTVMDPNAFGANLSCPSTGFCVAVDRSGSIFTETPNIGPTPTVTSVSPNQETTPGSMITISGTGFSTTSGATVIDFGAANPATGVSCSSSTTCTATAPPGTGTVDVSVTVQGRTSPLNTPSDQFTYVSMQITTPSLPAGARRVAYRVAVSAVGGNRPYKWFVISGEPPSGLRLTSTGVLKGKPRVRGTFTFTVKVVDHGKHPQTHESATESYSMVIS